MTTTQTSTTPAATINARLFALLNSVLKDGTFIPAMYHPVILNLVKPFLRNTSESDLRDQIVKLRDEIIPFILGE